MKQLPLIIGFFDGLHKGHLQLFKDLQNKKFNILTFINIPNKQNDFIYDNRDRISHLKELHPNKIYILDLQKSNMQTMSFVNLLLKKWKPSYLIVGDDFKFGRGRLGNIEQLNKYLKVKSVNINNKFKTSIAKNYIKEGQIIKANGILYKPYLINGIVIHGKQLGRKLGFKTANIKISNKCIAPKQGVYSGYTFINKKIYKSAVFVRDHLVETHLLNFNADIYGMDIKVQLHKYYGLPVKTEAFNQLKTVIGNKVKMIHKNF
jgi:riboflavin kinase/FMN adenylyltransferase